MAISQPRSACRILVFTSPQAGTGHGDGQVARLVALLRAQQCEVEVIDAIAALRLRSGPEAVDRPQVVVAAGGDGTLTLVAQTCSADTRIVPLPLGTENLVARHFGIIADASAVADVILRGTDRRIDAGIAGGRLFLAMASCGFDAEVVRGMHLTRRGHINRFSYAGPIVRAMRRYRFPELRIELTRGVQGVSESIIGRWAMVFNLPRYAGALGIEPSARDDDGQLDLIVLRHGGLAGGFRYLAGVALRRHIHWRDVVRIPVTGCRITSASPVAFQIDGDYGGRLPLEVRVAPGRVCLRVPPLAAGWTIAGDDADERLAESSVTCG